jgi:hypothetical protein
MTLTKIHGVSGLFILLVIILLVKPIFYNNLYNNILGRVVLIAILLFFSINNVTLGLLVALIIIIGTNMFFTEGFKSNDKTDVKNNTKTKGKTSNGFTSTISPSTTSPSITIGDADAGVKTTMGQIDVVTSSKSKGDGRDRISVENMVRSKNSDHFSVMKENFTSLEVSAADPHASTSGYVSQWKLF